jgi:hypothetical protein
MMVRMQGGDDRHALSRLSATQCQPRQQQHPDFPDHVG